MDLTEAEYDSWVLAHPMPNLDWTELKAYEVEDNTTSAQTLACTGNVCELVGVDAQ